MSKFKDPNGNIENEKQWNDALSSASMYAYPCRRLNPAMVREFRKGGLSMAEAADLASLEPGMTLRDYFAGQALMGICAHEDTGGLHGMLYQDASKYAYGIADAMIKERNK